MKKKKHHTWMRWERKLCQNTTWTLPHVIWIWRTHSSSTHSNTPDLRVFLVFTSSYAVPCLVSNTGAKVSNRDMKVIGAVKTGTVYIHTVNKGTHWTHLIFHWLYFNHGHFHSFPHLELFIFFPVFALSNPVCFRVIVWLLFHLSYLIYVL